MMTTLMDTTCEQAVRRTFGEMRSRGVAEGDALVAAVHVFRFHEPKLSLNAARQIVSAWVS